MPPDTELIRALLTLAAILGLGGMFLGVLYGLVVFRTRQLARRARGLMAALAARDQVIAGLKTDLLAGAARINEYKRAAVHLSRELDRVDKIRARTEAGCAAKNDELELARQHIQALTEHVEV